MGVCVLVDSSRKKKLNWTELKWDGPNYMVVECLVYAFKSITSLSVTFSQVACG
jgi:hypothetical protein